MFYNRLMNKILIVDDEEKIREMISKYAIHEGYDVMMAKDGLDAVKICEKNDFDLIIMDVMMPNLDGFKAYQRIKEFKDVPCIFLTALNEEYDRIYGFDIGGEDYVSKPFSLKELMMRIKVILKRHNDVGDVLKFKGLSIELKARIVHVDEKRVDLSLKEYELLVYLLTNQGIALSRESILEKVWGYDYYKDDRTLDTHMKLLRKALGPYAKYITTIRGVGYRFEKEA